MIIYFWRKSKKQCIRWGTGTLVLVIGIYLSYVWGKTLLIKANTLQIIQAGVPFGAQNVPNQIFKDEQVQVGEYAFVASKRGKYYYPSNCSKARSLSVKNMLYFKDKVSAQSAGFVEYLQCN